MNIPSGAMNTRFKEVEQTCKPVELNNNINEIKEVKKTNKREVNASASSDDYTVLDWVRTLLILTLPAINVLAIIVWIAKKPMNKTAGNYAIALLIYTCIMAGIGAIYYFFIM